MTLDLNLDQEFQSTSGTVRWTAFGNGPPLVLNHGTPFSSYVWRDIARALSAQYTVYIWDMPGYGRSAMYDGQDVSLAAQGLIFKSLLCHWGLNDNYDSHSSNPPLVVAHDFGGAVALRALLLHGAKYRRLALVDPVALAPWGSPFFRLVGENSTVFEQLPAPLHRALVREYIVSASSPGLHPMTLDKLAEPWVNNGLDGQKAFYRQIAQASQRYTDEVQIMYGQVDIPVVVCWGLNDEWIPVAIAHELVSLIPGAKLVLIEGAGHLVQEDAPAQLMAALMDFSSGFRS